MRAALYVSPRIIGRGGVCPAEMAVGESGGIELRRLAGFTVVEPQAVDKLGHFFLPTQRSLVQLWIPVGTAASRRGVRDNPERIHVGRAVRVLAGIGERATTASVSLSPNICGSRAYGLTAAARFQVSCAGIISAAALASSSGPTSRICVASDQTCPNGSTTTA